MCRIPTTGDSGRYTVRAHWGAVQVFGKHACDVCGCVCVKQKVVVVESERGGGREGGRGSSDAAPPAPTTVSAACSAQWQCTLPGLPPRRAGTRLPRVCGWSRVSPSHSWGQSGWCYGAERRRHVCRPAWLILKVEVLFSFLLTVAVWQLASVLMCQLASQPDPEHAAAVWRFKRKVRSLRSSGWWGSPLWSAVRVQSEREASLQLAWCDTVSSQLASGEV